MELWWLFVLPLPEDTFGKKAWAISGNLSMFCLCFNSWELISFAVLLQWNLFSLILLWPSDWLYLTPPMTHSEPLAHTKPLCTLKHCFLLGSAQSYDLWYSECLIHHSLSCGQILIVGRVCLIINIIIQFPHFSLYSPFSFPYTIHMSPIWERWRIFHLCCTNYTWLPSPSYNPIHSTPQLISLIPALPLPTATGLVRTN